MSCGSRSMEWEYLGLRADADAMRPAKPLPQPRVDYLNPNPAYMKKSASSKYGKHAVVQYGRVEDGIDFEYEVKNNGLKENIIVRACREDYTFCYRMKL